MKKLCMVTYMRIDEKFTIELANIAKGLNSKVDSFKCIIFCEDNINIDDDFEFDIEVICMSGTKYKRLLYLLENDNSEYYISVDNDIIGNLPKLEEFAIKVINESIDVAWGRIQAKPQNGLICKLVAIDKIISHYYIRPLLWKYNKGISIPGQCFMVKREAFKNKLMEIDTFLDDLALGTYVSLNNDDLNVLISKNILGLEIPNDKFKGLWWQRSRWADGYSTVLKGVKSKKERELVKIHGLAYHFNWILNMLFIFGTYTVNPIIALIYILIIASIISKFDVKLFISGILYQFIFPIFHLRWLYCLIKKLV